MGLGEQFLNPVLKPHFDLTIGGKPQSIARGAKMIGHAADEPKTACVARNLVGTSGIVELIRGLDDRGVAFLKIGQ
jgi:hypothetical protein